MVILAWNQSSSPLDSYIPPRTKSNSNVQFPCSFNISHLSIGFGYLKVLQSLRAKTLGAAVIHACCLAYLVLSWSANEWPESSLGSWWPNSESVPVSRARRPGISGSQLRVQIQQLLEIISGRRVFRSFTNINVYTTLILHYRWKFFIQNVTIYILLL